MAVIYTSGALVGGIVVGWLSDRIGRKAVINNVISQETKVPGSLNVIAKFYGAADR
jgi:MFS family permease